MSRVLYAAPAIFIAFFAALPAVASPVTIAKIIGSPSAYDDKRVEVQGTVEHVQHKISYQGNPYETFSLCSAQCVPVFAFGNLKTGNGDVVTVRGTYETANQINGYSLRNGIVVNGLNGDMETPCS